MTIGQLAKTSGVNVQTVRYYERRGILLSPRRSSAGYRLYGAGDVKRINRSCGAVEQLASACSNRVPTASCPILDALEGTLTNA